MKTSMFLTASLLSMKCVINKPFTMGILITPKEDFIVMVYRPDESEPFFKYRLRASQWKVEETAQNALDKLWQLLQKNEIITVSQ